MWLLRERIDQSWIETDVNAKKLPKNMLPEGIACAFFTE